MGTGVSGGPDAYGTDPPTGPSPEPSPLDTEPIVPVTEPSPPDTEPTVPETDPKAPAATDSSVLMSGEMSPPGPFPGP